MKIKHIVIFVVVFTIFNSSAQEESKFKRHEVGFNATLFVKQFLNFNSNTIPFSPYQLTYKYLTKKNYNLRFGTGISTTKTKETQLNSTPRETRNYVLNNRIGIERQSIINKHWKCYYGIDLTYDYMDTKSEFSNSYLRDKSTAYGGGPMMGIQYYFNDRISLYTEMNFLYKNTKSVTDVSDKLNPSQNQSTTKTELSANTIMPTTIFLAIKF